jgi:hypothetical protein
VSRWLGQDDQPGDPWPLWLWLAAMIGCAVIGGLFLRAAMIP